MFHELTFVSVRTGDEIMVHADEHGRVTKIYAYADAYPSTLDKPLAFANKEWRWQSEHNSAFQTLVCDDLERALTSFRARGFITSDGDQNGRKLRIQRRSNKN